MGIKAGALYFAIVFAIGFVMGGVRQLVLVPWLGEPGGLAVEAPVMLVSCFLAARWVIQKFIIRFTGRMK